MGTCQDEPEQLDDWNRIAELQQRNRVCPPHLKTCYPLESRPSLSLATITDEEMKTGDPRETLRRASMQPAQIAEGTGITTRQQRKRVSSEPHQGPGTPEVGGPGSFFIPCIACPGQAPLPKFEKWINRESSLSRGSMQGRLGREAVLTYRPPWL